MNGCLGSACATTRPLVTAPSAGPSSKKTAARCRRGTVSCRATGGGGRDSDDGLLWLPRRDVMLNGLSGVAAGLAWYPGLASGDDSPCKTADKVSDKVLQCADTADVKPCPMPSSKAPVDFTPEAKVTRVRQAVHLLSRENQEKYKNAVAKLKALPESNPLSFAAFANIHDAYCDSYYSYLQGSSSSSGSPADDPTFSGVHFSWLFAPWHRMYMYFYERALGQVIGDDTFALPYWNWDAPAGMGIPAIFKLKEGSLYDVNRNPSHIEALIDLELAGNGSTNLPFEGPKDQMYNDAVNKNLCTVYNQQVISGNGATAFLGDKYCTALGSATTGQGSLERMAHTAVHVWVGKAGSSTTETCSAATGGFLTHQGSYTCRNDMGFLGSAGWDPLFYSHHCNVDRLWHIWSTRLGGGQGFTDPDWLNTSFVFYDGVENPRKVRMTIRDVLDTSNLGYTFDAESDKVLPWLRCKIASLVPHGKGSAPARSKAAAPVFPLALTKGQVVEVPAVAVPTTDPGKEQVLVIEGIEFDSREYNKFDVAINVPADKALQVGPQYKEYAGTFAVVPGSGGGGTRQGKVSLCITNLLSDIEADGDSTVDVVIVPRTDAKVTLNVGPTIQYRE